MFVFRVFSIMDEIAKILVWQPEQAEKGRKRKTPAARARRQDEGKGTWYAPGFVKQCSTHKPNAIEMLKAWALEKHMGVCTA